MRKDWFNLMMLGLEAQHVIWLRSLKLAAGGAAAQREAGRMFVEKGEAAADAWMQLMTGASAGQIVRGYRTKVRANERRLSR